MGIQGRGKRENSSGRKDFSSVPTMEILFDDGTRIPGPVCSALLPIGGNAASARWKSGLTSETRSLGRKSSGPPPRDFVQCTESSVSPPLM